MNLLKETHEDSELKGAMLRSLHLSEQMRGTSNKDPIVKLGTPPGLNPTGP